MIDKLFIEQKLQKGKQAREKAAQLSDLSYSQLNWKPSADSWSIAECLEHLAISDHLYFDTLTEIINRTYEMTWWEKNSPLTSFWGKTLKNQIQETVIRKITAPKKFTPSSSNKPADFVRTYLSTLDTFLDLISKCKDIDLDKTFITSPSLPIATYNLRDAFEFLMNHEHRHINQAIRVKENSEFPKE